MLPRRSPQGEDGRSRPTLTLPSAACRRTLAAFLARACALALGRAGRARGLPRRTFLRARAAALRRAPARRRGAAAPVSAASLALRATGAAPRLARLVGLVGGAIASGRRQPLPWRGLARATVAHRLRRL